MGFVRIWLLLVLILGSIGNAPAWADKPSCADRVSRFQAQLETMRQEVTKQLQPTGGKPDAKTAQALKAEQERLSKADGLLREARTAAQANNEVACRQKMMAANKLFSCTDRITWLQRKVQTRQQEVTKQLQPTGGKPDAKTAQALKAEQERLSKADGLLREARTAAQANNEVACREKLQGVRTLLEP